MFKRTRRLRKNTIVRKMLQNVHLSLDDLIYPIFVKEGSNIKEEISSMPGQYRYSLDRLPELLDRCCELGIKALLLFGIPKHKDEVASEAYHSHGIVQKTLRFIKKHYENQFLLITDVCMCEYTSHGHCGILQEQEVDNDTTLQFLSKIALSHVQAGADMVAPSDMMDGRVQAIRTALEENGFPYTPIMAYSVKYASSFYGPFRDAADSAPSFGDRKSYQMDFQSDKEFYQEVLSDVEEGADFIMVKPGIAYLDILHAIKEHISLPLVSYQVSGEYSMIKAAALQGWIEEEKIVFESMIALKRAGADLIITYYALEIAQWLKEKSR
ncbi:porphobilinogen synthase [Fusobacterium necrophorum]|uniref:Delta-aminolevulinic acid dehydratase n=1 Tax=Fusobacterium necrophorum DJ-2 TaxID=1441737 RepID=A0AB73BZT9_9FUSO|nr:porphobilinogen synthase [Fusobacterium necrophorum]AYZ73127.1 porphobilinogen synthase [Fusobacterium necrophorum]AZW08876.1 porphobilinogen synthase [Fusobacterium necrophorum subsp. necrophorum]KDE61556.1 delta-aminolevulinic acid dehydratase [Fusobacterium necrophorum DJ-1]KDE69064.1 delta-aminolevulinic acid dehydratase [Fusobacterium necrophorum DJ-2]KDE70786.1 delta-aminolevulinic acid dehydratase [Fusobacterium necrophorum DAB]